MLLESIWKVGNKMNELCEKCGREFKPEDLNKELCKECDIS